MSEFVLHQEEGVVEAVARTGGAAGVVTATFFDGSIEIDLDGADVRNICGVRVYVDSHLRDEQYEWLSQLTSVSRRELEAGLKGPSRRRVGSARSRNFSAREFDTDLDTSFSVFAFDWCSRNPNSPKRSLVELLAVVGARRAGLWTPQMEIFSFDEILPALNSYQLAGMAERGRLLVVRALTDAVSYGILEGADETDLRAYLTLEAVAPDLEPFTLETRELFTLSRGSYPLRAENVSLSRSIHVESLPGSAPSDFGIQVWEGSAFADRVSARWVNSSNLSVTIRGAVFEDEQWWVRCFDQNSHVLLGAAPIKTESGAALILVKEGPVLLDVARSLHAPFLTQKAAATQDAINAGRRAGVLERLGDEEEAGETWRQCALKHEQAGDLHRAKMAGARTMMPHLLSEPLLCDYFL